MKIKLTDDYYFTGDRNQYMLYKTSIIQEGKNVGQEREQIIGYFQSISGLIQKLTHLQIVESSLTQLEDIKDLIEDFSIKVQNKIEENYGG